MIMASIEHLVAISYDISEAAVDCTLPGLEEMSCAADLTDMMSYWFNLGARISTSTLVCGAMDDTCAANIVQSFGDSSDMASVFIAAANDCQTDPWLCTYDIVTVIDVINAFVEDIIFAMQTCNNANISPKFLTAWVWLSPASGRRLTATSGNSELGHADLTSDAMGHVEQEDGNRTDMSKLYVELQAELDALTALAGKAKEAQKRRREHRKESAAEPNRTAE